MDAGIPTLGPDDTLEQDVQDGVGYNTKIPSSSHTHFVRKEKPMSADPSHGVGPSCGKASRNCDAGNGPGPNDVPRGMDPSRGVGSSRGEAPCILDAGGNDLRESGGTSGPFQNDFRESGTPPQDTPQVVKMISETPESFSVPLKLVPAFIDLLLTHGYLSMDLETPSRPPVPPLTPLWIRFMSQPRLILNM